jgi:hypothetical protein
VLSPGANVWFTDRDMSTPGEGGISCHHVTAWEATKELVRAGRLLDKVNRLVPG